MDHNLKRCFCPLGQVSRDDSGKVTSSLFHISHNKKSSVEPPIKSSKRMKSCCSEIESMLPTLFVQHVNKLAWEENDIASIVSTANQPG